jgi:uncharacterized protein
VAFFIPMIFYTLLVIAGLAGGFLAGITGIGTGFIMIVVIPIALKQMGIPTDEIVRFTIANTIFATMCSSLVNNLGLLIKGKLYIKETLTIAIAAAISSSILLLYVVLQPGYTTAKYNVIIIVLLAYTIFRTINKLRKSYLKKEKISSFKLITAGLSGGGVAALTGLGGGSIVIPMLNLWMRVDIKKAKSITYGAIFITALFITFLNVVNEPAFNVPYTHFGYLLLPVALPLSIGVVIASPLGMRFGEKLPSRVISYIFLSIITIVMLRKIIELIP